jgi:hypothetical protein
MAWSTGSSRRSSSIRSRRDEHLSPGIEVGGEVRALADTHRIEISQRLLDCSFDAQRKTRFDGGVGFDRPLSHGNRLRQPQQIARAQRS